MAKSTNSYNPPPIDNSPVVVANYSALPNPTTVSGKFYWVSASQGTNWLPGSLGGTFYNKGTYYSNGTNWEYISVPYQATQAEVNTGTNTDKFVTPNTLSNSVWAFTALKVLSVTLSTLSAASGSFTSSNTILEAFGKLKYFFDTTLPSLQLQIDSKLNEQDINIFCDFMTQPNTAQFANYENFFNYKNNSGWSTTAANAPTIDPSNLGVWYLKAGNSGNYLNLLASGENNTTLNQFALTSSISSYETFIYLDNLTDASTFISGFINQVLSVTQTNGAYFIFNPTLNSGKIQCITVNGGTATTSSITGITVTNKWYKFKVEATTTSVLYYIDGVLVATHTTNIPTGRMGYGFGINNNSTSTTVGIYADYFRAKFKSRR